MAANKKLLSLLLALCVVLTPMPHIANFVQERIWK